MTITTLDDAKVPTGEFVLPTGVVIRDAKGGAHLLSKIKLKEISGAEEDVIANDKMGFTARMLDVVAGCTESLSDDDGNVMDDPKRISKLVRRFAIGDLTACLFYIRIISVGTEYRQLVTCPYPKCDAGNGRPYSWTARFDLFNDFPVKKCKQDPMKDVHEYTSKRGTQVTWRYMTGEARLKFESNATTRERATAALMMRVVTVNGEPATSDNLRSLGMMDRKEIRDYMVEQEGGIDTTVEAECKNCGHIFKNELEMAGFSFFVPSETLED